MVYSHLKYSEIDVPFAYVCEHCGKESGTQIAEFRIGASSEPKGFTLSEQEDQRLTQKAQKAMIDYMSKYRRDVEEKGKFAEFFPNQCPHCGKRQVWGKGNTGRNQWLLALLCAGIGAAASFPMNGAGGMNLGLLVLLALFGLGVGLVIGLIFFNFKQSVFPPKPKHMPLVYWPDEMQATDMGEQ